MADRPRHLPGKHPGRLASRERWTCSGRLDGSRVGDALQGGASSIMPGTTTLGTAGLDSGGLPCSLAALLACAHSG